MAARAGAHIRSAAEVAVEHPDAARSSSLGLFLERPTGYTLTDCLSFVIMRRLKIDTAVPPTPFRQEGFRP